MELFDTDIITNEDGQGMVEYGLIISIIALIIIAVMMTLGPHFTEFFSQDLEEGAREQPVEEMEEQIDQEAQEAENDS